MKNRQTVVCGETPEDLIQKMKILGRDYLNLNAFVLGSEGLFKLIPIIQKELPNLKELYLNGNDLDTLPHTIVNLRNLEYLEVKNNNLKTLPDSLEKLTKLKDLDLMNNKFTAVPYGEKRPPLLRRVYVEDNPLSLVGLLKIFYNQSLRELYSVSQYVIQIANQLHNLPDTKNRATSVVKDHPDISVKEFYEFIKSLNANQVQKIGSSKLSYSHDLDDNFVVAQSFSSIDLKAYKKVQDSSKKKAKPEIKRSLSDSQLEKKSTMSPKREVNQGRRKIFTHRR